MSRNVEYIGGGIGVHVSEEHTFGTDSLLLAYFAWECSPVSRTKVMADLCSGCGIIPMLCFRDDKQPDKAYAVEIQQNAIDLMNLSIEQFELQQRLIPIHADLTKIKTSLPTELSLSTVELVTCNPPYKAAGTGVPSSSKSDLIARHETMCTLAEVCSSASALLRTGGRLCICQLPERLPDIISDMRSAGIEPKRLRFVQQTFSSAPWLVLVEGRKGSKPFLQVEAPLIMRDDGAPSEEMQHIYRFYGKM